MNMKQRRVGTFTLAIILIFLGIAIPLSLFWGDRFGFILRFAPLALVALGVEVLISAITKKDEKLTYDGLSIFLSIVITVVTIFSATVVPFISRGFEQSREFQKFRQSYTAEVEDKLGDSDITASVWIHGDSWFDDWYLENEKLSAYVSVNIEGGKSKDLEQAKDELVKAARVAVEDERVENVSASNNYEDKNGRRSMHLNMSASRIRRLSDSELEESIDVNGGYSEEWSDNEDATPYTSSEITDDGFIGEESNVDDVSSVDESARLAE